MKELSKKTTKGFLHRNTILVIVALFVFGSFAFANQAHAGFLGSLFSLGGISLDVINEVLIWLLMLIKSLVGIFVMLAVFLTQWALQLSTTVASSKAVTTGTNITLSLANLGFVTILIIIAIATILRRESYGVKALLAKLIIATLLVNFSLPIARSFLEIADQFTYYFLQALPGTSSGTAVQNFGDAISNAFQPQSIGNQMDNTVKDQVANQVVGDTDLKSLIAVTFSVVFLTIMLIVLLALFIMLLVRYVTIGILLILMPLAWVTWITPYTKQHWEKWWHEFISWTFFAPLMMMFIYITIQTVYDLGNNPVGSGSAKLGTALSGAGVTGGVMNIIGQQMIVIGLLIGGLITAKSMGGKIGNAALSTGKNLGKNFAKWTGQKAAGDAGATAGAILRTKAGRSTIGLLQKTPFLRGVGNALDRASTSGSKADIAKEKEKAKNMSDSGVRNAVAADMQSGKINAKTLTHFQEKEQREGLSEEEKRYVSSHKNEFSKIGAEGWANKTSKQTLYDDNIKNLLQESANAKQSGDKTKIAAASSNLTAALTNKLSDASEEDMKALGPSLKNILSNNVSFPGESREEHDTLQETVSIALSNTNPATLNNLMSKSKGDDIPKIMRTVINNKIDGLRKMGVIKSDKEAEDYKDLTDPATKGGATSFSKLIDLLGSSTAENQEFNKDFLNKRTARIWLKNKTGQLIDVSKKNRGES